MIMKCNPPEIHTEKTWALGSVEWQHRVKWYNGYLRDQSKQNHKYEHGATIENASLRRHRIYGGKIIIKRQERSRSKTNFTRPSNGEDDTASKVERNGRHRFSGICCLRWNSKQGLKRIWPPRRHRDMDSFERCRIHQTHLWTYATDLHQDWPWSGLQTQLHYFRMTSRRENGREKYVRDKRK